MHRASYQPSALILIKPARSSTLLALGAFDRLASGGPIEIIAALDADDMATVRWIESGDESVLPEICLVSASSVCRALAF